MLFRSSRNFVISKIFNLPIKYVEFSLLERLLIKLKFTNFLAFTILNDNNYRYFKSLNEKKYNALKEKGKRVPENFEYSSDNNHSLMKKSEINKFLKKYINY